MRFEFWTCVSCKLHLGVKKLSNSREIAQRHGLSVQIMKHIQTHSCRVIPVRKEQSLPYQQDSWTLRTQKSWKFLKYPAAATPGQNSQHKSFEHESPKNFLPSIRIIYSTSMFSWVYFDVLIYFELFLQVNMDLRCRMVTWFYLDFIIYVELFLQVNMDPRCRMVSCIYLDFILSSMFFFSCFCKEMWTLGIGWLHDFYTCAELISHWQEANLKTSNIYFYIYWISRIFQ